MQRLIFLYITVDNTTLNSTSDHFGTNPVDIEKPIINELQNIQK